MNYSIALIDVHNDTRLFGINHNSKLFNVEISNLVWN